MLLLKVARTRVEATKAFGSTEARLSEHWWDQISLRSSVDIGALKRSTKSHSQPVLENTGTHSN